MQADAGDLLRRLLEAAFLDCSRQAVQELVSPTCTVVDVHLAENTREAFIELVDMLAHAIEERALSVFVQVANEKRALGHFELRGLHVGVGWGVVPLGRRIDIHGSTAIDVLKGRITRIENAWATSTWLRSFGLHDDAAGRINVYATTTAGAAAQALAGSDPHRTRWARHWRLPPYLSMTAALLMAGVDVPEMAKALGVTASTAHTYVRELYRATGVHGRLALLRSAETIASNSQPNG